MTFNIHLNGKQLVSLFELLIKQQTLNNDMYDLLSIIKNNIIEQLNTQIEISNLDKEKVELWIKQQQELLRNKNECINR